MRHRTLVALLLAGALLPAAASSQATRTSRDSWQRVDDVIAALGVEEGETIADVGAGSGFFTFRISPRVGPNGRVLAVDINAGVLRELREEAQDRGIGNIETIVSEPDDPMLQAESVDGILVVNAYHEMEEYEAMLGWFRHALKPGGRLVIIDMPPRDSTLPRRQQVVAHDIAIGLVARDVEAAGFEVIERDPDFVSGSRRRQWMLVAVVPSEHP